MKKCLLYCLLLAIFLGNPSNASSQVVVEDSIRIWMSLSETLLKQNPERSFQFARKALDYTRTYNRLDKQAGASLQLGRTFLALNKPDSAKIHLNNAIQLAISQGDSLQAGLAYNGLGILYIMSEPNYAQALQELKTAHRLTKHDSTTLVIVLNSLANLFKRTEEYDTALFLYHKVLSFSQNHRNYALASDAINNIGGVYTNLGEYALAINWLQQSVAIKKTINDWDGATRSLINIGMSYADLKEFDKAEKSLQEALEIIERQHFNFLEVLCHYTFADLYFQKGDFDKSFQYAQKSELLCNQYKTHLFRKRIYELLSELHEATNDPAKSLFYKKKVNHLIDSMALSERKTMLSAQDQTPTSAATNTDNKNLKYALWILSSIIVASIIGLIIWFKRKRSLSTITEQSVDVMPEEPVEPLPESSSENTIADIREEVKSLEVIDGPGLKLLSFNEINWFQKEEKHYYVFSNNGTERFRVRQTLEELEALLPASEFFRINRAVIVNINSIANYSFWENRKYILRTKSKHEFTISSARLKELKDLLNVEMSVQAK